MSDDAKFSVAQSGRFILSGVEVQRGDKMYGPMLELRQGLNSITVTKAEAENMAVHLHLWARKDICQACGREKE